MLLRYRSILLAGLAACLAWTGELTSARATEPIAIKPAIYRRGPEGTAAQIQPVRWGGGYRGGYGGFRGYGGYRGGYGGYYGGGFYRPYYGYGGYGPGFYRRYGYGYPMSGYGYGYGYPGYGYGIYSPYAYGGYGVGFW